MVTITLGFVILEVKLLHCFEQFADLFGFLKMFDCCLGLELDLEPMVIVSKRHGHMTRL